MFFVRLFDLRLFGFVYFCSSSSCLGRAAVCDCGTPWTFLLPFFMSDLSVCIFIGMQLIQTVILVCSHSSLYSK